VKTNNQPREYLCRVQVHHICPRVHAGRSRVTIVMEFRRSDSHLRTSCEWPFPPRSHGRDGESVCWVVTVNVHWTTLYVVLIEMLVRRQDFVSA